MAVEMEIHSRVKHLLSLLSIYLCSSTKETRVIIIAEVGRLLNPLQPGQHRIRIHEESSDCLWKSKRRVHVFV